MQPEKKLLNIESASIKMYGDEMKFAGYASVFGGVDAYGDTIDPKAYNRTLKRGKGDRPIKMRWNHYGPVIGKWIDMRVDEKGLWVEGELTPDHSVASDVYASMKHGAVDGMSIGYFPKKVEMLDEGKRLLKEIELVEISVVEDPADLGAKINDVKSAIDAARSLKEIENLLRDVGGFSNAQAKAIIAQVKAIGELRDEEPKPAVNLDELLAIRSSIFR